MEKIKIKNVIKGTIKNLDKGAIVAERIKDNLVNIKNKVENSYNNDTDTNEYVSNKVQYTSNRIIDENISSFNISGKKAVSTTKNNIIKKKNQIKTIKTKIKRRNQIKKLKHNIKNGKIALQKSNKFVKTTKKVASKSIKTVKNTKRTIQSIKAAIKLTISAIKGIIAGTKALISAIIAGGWVAVIVILVICLVALLCSSIYGVFFSNEDVNSEYELKEIVKDLNEEVDEKISKIKEENIYTNYKINSERAEWKEILAIYVVEVSSSDEDVLIITEEKKEKLETIFWEMTTIDSEIKNEDNEQILYINISGKSIEEMIEDYDFTEEEKEHIETLLSDGYNSLWTSVIYGIEYGKASMASVALSQVGNVGGEPYWRWYGYNARVEWCAVFVSWVANELGYIDAKVIPKFVACINGVDWFKEKGQWKNKDYTPREGDIIFFDWEQDDSVDHVGIVVKIENNKVHTVEGNSNEDTCRQKEYNIGSKYIYGYGVPNY